MFFFSKKGNNGKQTKNAELESGADVLALPSAQEKTAEGALLLLPQSDIERNKNKVLGITQDEKSVIFNPDAFPANGQNTMLFGRAKAGKTISFLLPDLLRVIVNQESTIIADPDGELYDITADAFEAHGYDVKVLNTKNPSTSNKWSPTENLGDKNNVEEVYHNANSIAQAMVQNLIDESDSDIGKATQALMTAVIMRLYLDNEFSSDFGTVCNVTDRCKSLNYASNVFNTKTLNGDIRACLGPYEQYITERYRPTSEIVNVLERVLSPLRSRTLLMMLSENEFDFTATATGNRPCAYFVVYDKSNNLYKAITALFFRMAYTLLTALPKKSFVRPVNIYIDGIEAVGIIPKLSDALQAGIRAQLPVYTTIALQNINSIRRTYSDWQSICLNCFIQVSLGLSDEVTARYFSMLIEASTKKKKKKKKFLFWWVKPKDVEEEKIEPTTLLQANLNETFIAVRGKGWLRCMHREV